MKYKYKILLSLLLFLMMSLPCFASPDVLYSKLYDASKSGSYSNLGTGNQETADNFQLAQDSTVTGITWFGFYDQALDSGVTAVDFSIAFFSDSSGLPGTELVRHLVSALVSDTGDTVTKEDGHKDSIIYQFVSDPFPDVSILAGQEMWISISEADDDTDPVGDTQWLWCYNATSGNSRSVRVPPDPWLSDSGDHAFILTGTPVIPAPGAVLLGSIGVSLVGWMRRRRTI